VRADLNQMAVFASVVKAGSFAAAARALGMPKSTVSKRIAELEDRLATQLLHRTTRTIKLTQSGAAYYEQCMRIVQEAEEADRAIAESDASLHGTVRVTAPWLLGETLEPVMERFLADHANVTLDLWLTDRRVDLIEEGVDLAIRAGALPDSSLVARRLGDVEHRIVASPAYLAGGPPIRVPKDLEAHRCVAFRERRDAAWPLQRGDKKVSVHVEARYTVASLHLVRHAALAGIGIAHVPQFLVEQDFAARRLVRLLPEWTIYPGAVHVVHPSSRNLSPRVRALADLLVETFAKDRPWVPAMTSEKRRGRT
jgi:DNA-binding transcriptional LysR family regulator